MLRTISLSSLIIVLINSSLICSQEIVTDGLKRRDLYEVNENKENSDGQSGQNTILAIVVIFLFIGLFLLGGSICCYFHVIKPRLNKNKSDRNITTSNTLHQIIKKNPQLVSNKNNKVDELDLENNWITDVYSNNSNLKKDIFGFKKKFYNLDNDSLQSVQLSSEEKKISNSDSNIVKSNVIDPPPHVYLHPSSTPGITLPLNEISAPSHLINETNLSEKALEFLVKNPPTDELPIQAEIHSICKVHENIYLNPYSSWKFVVENSTVAESGVVQITNYGKLVEINTRKWSSVTKDVCVQSNYPFFVPKSTSARRNSISTPADRLKRAEIGHVKRNSSTSVSKFAVREEVIHYFEVTVLSIATDVDTIISVGLSTKPYPHFRLPGWNKHSVGYQSNNGYLYHNDPSSGKDYGPTYTVGDTIGCGYKPATKEIFFTKNGDYLGNYTTAKNPFAVDIDNDLQHVWYPTIAANGQCKLEINFGGDVSEGTRDLFKYKMTRNFGPGAPLSIVKKLRGGELSGCYEKCKSENVELERVGLK